MAPARRKKPVGAVPPRRHGFLFLRGRRWGPSHLRRLAAQLVTPRDTSVVQASRLPRQTRRLQR